MVDARRAAPSSLSTTRALAFGHASAWLVLGALNVVFVSLLLEAPGGGRSVRFLHHLVDSGRHVAVALASLGAYELWQRAPAKLRGYWPVATFVGLLLIGWVVLAPDLRGMAVRNADSIGVPVWSLQASLVTVVALGATLCVVVSRWFRRRKLRLLPLPVVAMIYYVDCTVSPHDNPGAHFFASFIAASLLGGALAWPAPWFERLDTGTRTLQRVTAVLASAWAVAGIGLPLKNAVRIDLGQWHANLLPQFTVAKASSAASGDEGEARANPFFQKRETVAPRPPSSHQLLPEDGWVIVLSIDALRQDFLTEKNESFFENIATLMARGTSFTNARAPGSSTVYSLSTLSTGRYFSQQYWTKKRGDYWPTKDESTHFASVLSDRGIRTIQSRSASWMGNKRGVLRGFDDSVYEKGSWKWARGKELVDRLLPLLEQHQGGRLFAFGHFLDTHYPYWPGKKKSKSQKGRFLHALEYVDGQIGRVVEHVEALGAADRTTFIITADHGEAFGEHNGHGHATTLYEEVLRVPLIVSGPGIPRQTRHEAVSLVDVGPTVIDLFGLPTPASFMGESVVPALVGGEQSFRRPIVAEARGLQAMVFDDGIKVIRDRIRDTLEVYDLERDPKEKRNLADDLTPSTERQVATLRRFFDVHTRTQDGYKVPLRK